LLAASITTLTSELVDGNFIVHTDIFHSAPYICGIIAMYFQGELMNPREVKSQFLQAVITEAKQRWGEEKWVVNLTKEYIKVLHANGDTEATVVNRRRSVERALVEETCNFENFIALAHCVDCRIQLTATRTEVLVP
jgi:hypothetical protein